MLFVNLAKSGFTLVVISMATPPFIALIIPLGFMYYWIQRYYLRTSRELKRLDSVSRSPIYAHFQETLGGVSTIRAFRQESRFELESEWRVDANLRAYFPSISANRWLAIRLEFIGALVILAAASFAVTYVSVGYRLSSGWVGLAMSYALQITTSLNWIVRQSVEVETNIVSVERVLEYARLPSEAPEIVHRNRPPVSWPADGAVEFVNYSTRYRPGLDLVLKNISLDIKAHEKIGVVGRTGAGKSSLTLALFRIIEADSGHISIDNVNTSSIGLLDLRRRLAIIPQDAALFEGTIRDNLDPGHVHDDTELWSVLGKYMIMHRDPRLANVSTGSGHSYAKAIPCAVCLHSLIHISTLEHARLKEHVSSMEGGLEAKVNEGGKSYKPQVPRLSPVLSRLFALHRFCVSVVVVVVSRPASSNQQSVCCFASTVRKPKFYKSTPPPPSTSVKLNPSRQTVPRPCGTGLIVSWTDTRVAVRTPERNPRHLYHPLDSAV